MCFTEKQRAELVGSAVSRLLQHFPVCCVREDISILGRTAKTDRVNIQHPAGALQLGTGDKHRNSLEGSLKRT